MSIWGTVTWDVARAGGITAYALLTLAVIAGLALSLHLQTLRWPRLINNELHNFITLLATMFTGVHVLAVAIDPYTHFGLNEVLIPFASHYRPVWVALGIGALYLGIAIGISTWLRRKIGYVLWRRLHVVTLVIWGLVTVHGLTAGSDSATWWARAIYLVSVAVVGYLLVMRFFGSTNAPNAKVGHTAMPPVPPAQRPGMPLRSVTPQPRRLPPVPARQPVGAGSAPTYWPRQDPEPLEVPSRRA